MDGSLRFLFSACFLLTVAVLGSNAECTEGEVQKMLGCMEPYGDRFLKAFGTSTTCNRAAITSNDLCGPFGSIVNCINCLSLSETKCRPVIIQTANAGLSMNDIPCNVQAFVSVCTNAPRIYEGKSGTSNPCSGSAVQRVTFLLLVSTVTAAVLCML